MNTVELFKNIMINFGAEWVLWILVILFTIVVAISLERWFYFQRRSGNTQIMASVLENYLRGKTSNLQWPKGGRAFSARIVEAGLAMVDYGPEAVTQAMQSRAALEHELLERRLIILGTIGNNAPFVGLFGTVIGVVHAFVELGQAAAAGQQQTSTVMIGIAEALVSTAIGLFVAIPAVALYNYFQRRMQSMESSADVLSRLLLTHIALGKKLPASGYDTAQNTNKEKSNNKEAVESP